MNRQYDYDPQRNNAYPQADPAAQRPYDANYSRNDAGYPRHEAGYANDAPYGREEAGYGRNDAQYARDEAQYARDEAAYGRPEAPYGRNDGGYERNNANARRNDPRYDRQDQAYDRNNSGRGYDPNAYYGDPNMYRTPQPRQQSAEMAEFSNGFKGLFAARNPWGIAVFVSFCILSLAMLLSMIIAFSRSGDLFNIILNGGGPLIVSTHVIKMLGLIGFGLGVLLHLRDFKGDSFKTVELLCYGLGGLSGIFSLLGLVGHFSGYDFFFVTILLLLTNYLIHETSKTWKLAFTVTLGVLLLFMLLSIFTHAGSGLVALAAFLATILLLLTFPRRFAAFAPAPQPYQPGPRQAY